MITNKIITRTLVVAVLVLSSPAARALEPADAIVGADAPSGAGASAPVVVLNEAEYREKVYACWLGKSIGGTLGMPVEGGQEMHAFTFYAPVPTTPAPNDDLDLQLLWVRAAQEHGAAVDAHVLSELWLKYVCVDWNEYGVGRANLRDGFPAPMSGQFRNERWRDSNGAWIRSETWACLLPGRPALAVRYAWEDACVDHGAAEGTIAELFTAALQSAAFVEADRDRLLQIALTYVPPGSAVAHAVRVAIEARRQGLDLKAARERAVEATKSTGWFMAPRNVAFVVLGLLYGEGDFGKSICATVNCGDDTDSTGATIGALMGILLGPKGISEEWRKPVGEGIQNVAIAGFDSPRTIGEFTDQTVRTAKAFLKDAGAQVEIRADRPTDLRAVAELGLVDPATAAELWARSPWRVTRMFEGLRVVLDFQKEPTIEAHAPRTIELTFENLAGEPVDITAVWGTEPGLSSARVTDVVKLPARGGRAPTIEATFTAPEIRTRILRGSVKIARGGKVLGSVPFAFLGKVTVSKDDLALARLGAKATSDSELDREPGCTAKANDGDIEGQGDFGGKRWHSALTTHPHWVAIELPAPRKIGRVVIHAADPDGYPVDFDGEASMDGKTWTTLFRAEGSAEARRIERTFPPLEAKHFRLTIRRSANPKFPDAAQVSEIELLEK